MKKGNAAPQRPARRPDARQPERAKPEKAASQRHPAKPGEPGAPCPVYRKCGGCQLQNMDYPRQLAWKQSTVRTLLGSYCEPAPILGMEHPFHYRNKVQAAFGVDRNGRTVSGIYQSGTHHIVSMDHCMTEDRKADEIIVTIRKLLAKCKIPPYDERRGTGFLRHVLVKRGFQSGQIMVVLVAASPIFPAKKYFLKDLLAAHPDITTILLNINKRFTSMLLGDDERILYGPGRIEESLCGLNFSISARAFYQINPSQTEALYNTAIRLAGLTGKETVLDAYCGVGTIGLIAASGAKQVIGVENNPDAVRDAKENARRNKIENADFRCGDAGEFLEQMALDRVPVDVVFMDPPRAGSDRRFLESLLRMQPERVVYISCNPETQARDLSVLGQKYKAKALQPVDMFPHTRHVETVCLLEKKSH